MRPPRRSPIHFLVAAFAFVGIAAAAVLAEPGDDTQQTVARRPLLPIPATGAVPPIVDSRDVMTEDELAHRALARQYTREIRAIRYRYFGQRRAPALREAGFAAIREFVDPAAFRPMIEELAGEQDDVRRAMLDHLSDQGDEGQAALAWAAIHEKDETLRNESVRRMVTPPSDPVLRVLDPALRRNQHDVANRAGALAGTLGALRAIPLLIFAQATRDRVPTTRATSPGSRSRRSAPSSPTSCRSSVTAPARSRPSSASSTKASSCAWWTPS